MVINVSKAIINHPPVITIFIGNFLTIPSHPLWHCFTHMNHYQSFINHYQSLLIHQLVDSTILHCQYIGYPAKRRSTLPVNVDNPIDPLIPKVQLGLVCTHPRLTQKLVTENPPVIKHGQLENPLAKWRLWWEIHLKTVDFPGNFWWISWPRRIA